MNPVAAQRAEEIKKLVCRVLEVDHEQIGDTDLFTDDLGADSMDLIELLAHLEIEFDIEIDSGEIDRLVNLRGVHDVLNAALGT